MSGTLHDEIGSVAFSLAFRIVTDPVAAEEIVARVFATLGEGHPQGPDRDAVSTQALLRVRSEAFVHRQAERRRRAEPVVRDARTTDLPGPASGDIPSALMEVQRQRLRTALGSLQPHARDAIELMFFEGMTVAELSTRLGISVDAVRTSIHAGLCVLRDAAVTRS